MALLIICVIVLVVLNIALLIGIYEKNTNSVCVSGGVLCGRTAVVTGGTAGMGLQIARDLAQRGARVIVACPEPQEGARALALLRATAPTNHYIYYHPLDLACFASTRNFATHILATEDRLDILVNNAGVGGPNDVTSDGLNFVMQVNYYGTFLLTLLLVPLLKKTGRPGEPSRIVNVASVLHWLGTVNSKTSSRFLVQTYANSKLNIVMFSQALAKKLKGSNVVINVTDPGLVGTQIYSTYDWFFGPILTFLCWALFKNPWQGAQTALHVALDPQAGEVSGEYFKNCKLATRRVYNEQSATKLWEDSVETVKITEKELENCFESL